MTQEQKPHVSASLKLYAHNQPTAPGNFRLAGETFGFGSKKEQMNLGIMLYSMVLNVEEFHINSGALSETESLVQLRKFMVALEKTVNEYEKALAAGVVKE